MTDLGLLELQSKFKASLGKILSQNKKRKKVWEYCSVSEHLLSMFEALGTTLRENREKVLLPRRALWDALESTETPSKRDHWAVLSVDEGETQRRKHSGGGSCGYKGPGMGLGLASAARRKSEGGFVTVTPVQLALLATEPD